MQTKIIKLDGEGLRNLNAMLTELYRKKGFEDRGDPSVADFTQATLTADGNWHDLDLSNIIPSRAKSVLLVCTIMDETANNTLYLRKKGNVNILNIINFTTQVANVFFRGDGIVACDKDRKIQYWLTAVPWTEIKITVKGWWK